MRYIGKFLSKNSLLILILLLASLLRFVGTIPGYPPIHTDEGISHSQGIAMILEKTLDPKYGYGVPYNYPIMVPLINAFFYLFVFIPLYLGGYLLLHLDEIPNILSTISSGQFGDIFERNILGPNRINVVFWGRIVTAFFGIGIVFLSYLLSQKLFKSLGIGLLSAFFVAINYRQVLNSHFGLPDIYNAFFLQLALFCFVLLWEKQTWKRYILAGAAAALFFSTKFQLFAFPPLLIVLIFLSLKRKKWLERGKFFLKPPLLLMIVVISLTILILNIFHLLHLSETLEQVTYSALKYRYGKSSLDLYSLLYLYYIGVGPALTFTAISGVVLGLIGRLKQTLFLLSVIIPFMWMFIYYTGGGFYTRNFITVTPLLLIIAAYGFWWFTSYLKRRSFYLMIVASSIFLSVVTYQSLSNSLVVGREYSNDWNYKIIQSKLGNILPAGAIVLTDPSMVLPQKKLNVVYAQSARDYQLAEIQEKGIEWVVLNTEWFNIHYLWWMSQDFTTLQKLGWKPNNLLFNTPLSKIIWELKSYIVFEALNPWQAPDNNFLVIKIPPKNQFKDGVLIYEEDFSLPDKWKVVNSGFGDADNFSWEKDFGYSNNGSLKIGQSKNLIYSQRFISPKIQVAQRHFYKINSLMRSSSDSGLKSWGAFIGADFLSEKEEILKTSLLSPVWGSNDWLNKEVITYAPTGSKYLQLYFQSGDFTSNFWLDDVTIWQTGEIPSEIKIETPYIKSRFKLEEHLFLNSNGGM